MSDLSTRSDAAIEFAGGLAHVLGSELTVLHAMGLRYRPMRAVMPALKDIHATVRSIDQSLRAQIRRVAPELTCSTPPLVDVDDAPIAIRRHATELDPMVVVTPNLWDWNTETNRKQPDTRVAFAQLTHPLLIIREPRRQVYDRVLIISTERSSGDETVEAAGRWGFWLEHVYDRAGAPDGPDFDVLKLDDECSPRELSVRLINPRTDLIVLDKAIFGLAELQRHLGVVMLTLLRQTVAPIVVSTHPKSSASTACRPGVLAPNSRDLL